MQALRKMDSSKDTSLNIKINELSKISFLSGIRPLAFDWAVIFFSMYLSTRYFSVPLYILSLIVIASRQHALLVLVHEGAHFRFAKNHKLNNAISDFLAAFPIFFCTNTYRTHHLKHHRYLNTMQDPDWVRKYSLPEWTFPQTRTQLLRTMLKILATGWYKMIFLFISLSGLFSRNTYTSKAAITNLGKKILYYSVVGFTLFKFDAGIFFVGYWLLPYLVILPVIERIRSISEHFALSYEGDFNQTRDILCDPIEAFMFGPHNIRYHLTHHLHPSIPQYNLPLLHSELTKDPIFSKTAHQNKSYFFGKKSILEDLIRTPEVSHE